MTNHPLRSKPSQSIPTTDLFLSSPAEWGNRPDWSFATWLEAQGFRKPSRVVYTSLWTRFATWATERHIRLDDISSRQIMQFLESLTEVRRQQRERYHRVIERAYLAMTQDDTGSRNPASQAAVPAGQGWRDAQSNNDTVFFSASQWHSVIHWIQTCPAPQIDTPSEVSVHSRRAPAGWRHARDRALCAVLVGAGLKLAEIIALQRSDIDEAGDQWCLRVQPANSEARSVGLASFAQPVVAEWMRVLSGSDSSLGPLSSSGISTESSLVFPASAAGGRLDTRTVNRLVKNLFTGAALEGGVTPQRLRNGFAAQLFDRDASLDDVQAILGHRTIRSTMRLHEQWTAWCA